MKRLLVSLLFITGGELNAADTGYISDEMRVPVRSTPCNSCKIVHHGIKSGTEFKIIEQNSEGWTHIKTRRGTEGWLPTQYVSKERIAKLRIVEMEAEVTSLGAENTALKNSLQELSEKSSNEYSALSQLAEENSQLSAELVELKRISANSVNLHEQNQELLKLNSILQNNADVQKNTINRLTSNKDLTWFLYGMAAVFSGVLLTLLLPTLRPKRRFTEWG